jgi:hypothetical protein
MPQKGGSKPRQRVGICYANPLAKLLKGRRARHVNERIELPRYYFLDESDPDILVLRRQDGSFVAAFSSSGATREGIVEAAKEDYQRLLSEGVLPEGPEETA